MKDRRIWVIIGCILVVGIAITSYTSSVVKKVPQEQKIQVLSETTAETAVDSDSAPLQAVPREAQAKMKAGDPEQTEAAGAGIRSEKETEARTAEETEESNSSEDQVQVQAADPPDEGLEPVLHDAEPVTRLICWYRKMQPLNRSNPQEPDWDLISPFPFSMVFLSEMCFMAISVNLIYMENQPWT